MSLSKIVTAHSNSREVSHTHNDYNVRWKRCARSLLPKNVVLTDAPSPLLNLLEFGYSLHRKFLNNYSLEFLTQLIDRTWKSEIYNTSDSYVAILPPSIFYHLHLSLGSQCINKLDANAPLLKKYLQSFSESVYMNDILNLTLKRYLSNNLLCVGNQLLNLGDRFKSKGAGYWHRDAGGSLIKAYFCIDSTSNSYAFDIVPFPLLDPMVKEYEIHRPTFLEKIISDQDFVSIQLEPGDLLLFDTNCIHRGNYFNNDNGGGYTTARYYKYSLLIAKQRTCSKLINLKKRYFTRLMNSLISKTSFFISNSAIHSMIIINSTHRVPTIHQVDGVITRLLFISRIKAQENYHTYGVLS